MNQFNKSEHIKAGIRASFRNGSSKMARRRCYGYSAAPDGRLVIDRTEAEIIRWIFQKYLDGDSLGKIAAGLEKQGILSPTGKLKWNREAIDKLLSNEKYTGRVLLQKTISTGTSQIENNGLMYQYLYTDNHECTGTRYLRNRDRAGLDGETGENQREKAGYSRVYGGKVRFSKFILNYFVRKQRFFCKY